MLVVFLLLSSLSLLCSGERTLRNKYVTTSLDAKWQQTALHLEAVEYLRDECPEYLWEFVELSCAANIGQEGSDKTRYDSLMDLVGIHFLSPSQRPLLRLALALRLYSPRVEADQQMASSVALPAACRSSDAFAVLGAGRVVCSPDQLNDELLKLVGTAEAAGSQLFPADRHYRTDAPADAVTTVLYGEIGSQSFCQMHEAVKKLAQAGRVDYVMRHYSKTRPESRVRLSGYAVELAIKSTEYKAQDDTKVAEDDQQGQKSSEADDEVEGFVFSKLRELHPELSGDLNAFQRHLVASSADMAPLKVWQLQELSLQAAKRVTQAGPDEAVKLMTSLSQNFPSIARSLIRTKVEKALKSEIKSNYNSIYHSLNLDNGDAALFINGMMFDIDSTDIYSMFDYIREEDNVINGMAQLGVPRDSFLDLLRLELGVSKEDRFAVDFRDSAVHWLNDIERNEQYSRFPASLMELLRPAYPGMLRTVRHNMYHVVMIMDPSLAESVHLLKTLMSLYGEQMPMTFGVVWLVKEDEDVTGLQDAGVAMVEAFNYIMQHGQKPNPGIRGVQFIAELLGKVDPGGRASAADVHSSFGTLFPDAVEADVFGQMSEYDIGRTLAADYIRRLGLSAPPQVLFNGVPLASSALSAGNMEETLLQELMQSLQAFTKAVYRQELADGEDVAEWIVSQPNVMPRLNERVLKEGPVRLDFTASVGGYNHSTAAEFSRMTSRDMSASIGGRLNYVRRPGAARLRTLSYWVIADLETTSGRRLLRDVLIQMKASRDIRAAFVANPVSHAPELNPTNVRALAAGRLLPSDELLTYLLALIDQQSPPEQVLSESSRASVAAAIDSPAAADALHVDATYAARVLHMAPAARGLVVNGRLVGPFEPLETFSEDDLTLLEKYTTSGSVDTLQRTFIKHMKHDDTDLDELSDVFMKLSALLKSRKHHKSRWNLPKLQDTHSVLRLPARDPTRPSFDLVAVCDPISRGAQKLGPLLSVLQQALNVDVQLVLNAKDKHSDMPLKSYYRLVLDAEPRFDPDGRLAGPSARFSGIPGEPILTQHYHVPDNWIVEAVDSPHDLDNIKLDDVEHGVHSDFELEHLLVEGHCFEQSSGSPPRGLQITLSPSTAAAQLPEEGDQLVDTIVMANLGYFQLKANPGAWALRLRPGRSQEIYKMVSLDGVDLQLGTSSSSVAAGSDGGVAARAVASVVVNSFTSNVLKLRVAKKPDKQQLDLLRDETTDTASGIWNSLKSTFGSSAPASDGEDDTLNIFSLASGHLYERLMRIMMLSVLKHTSSPVKFWFLKNYLSPTFKDLLEPMSREFGFRYELVQYNWPRWLHQQTEKQRIIWGYKILFLDVLFPLSLKKFIFVDADQIVRADLKELRDLDLEGAPYAYTPFCDSRTEMDGFRFWNQGYWRSHLQGRKYHISALYVVDLKKFRQIAAGDRLRGQYQGLSQDPNSLSNLDQDLPNNMIHQVRIKSLPQEWLWCETWCDDASKATAKTIDLCNNPLTKEAKLSAAARIAPEWVQYDNTIRDFLARVKANSSTAKTADGGSSSAGASHEEL